MEGPTAPETDRQRARVSAAEDLGASPILRRPELVLTSTPVPAPAQSTPPAAPPAALPGPVSADKTAKGRTTGRGRSTRRGKAAPASSECASSDKEKSPRKRKPSAEIVEVEVVNKKLKMDEEMRAFMSEMRKKMDDLPTRDHFNKFERTIQSNSERIECNKKGLDEHGKQLASMRESIERIELEQIQARRSLSGKIDQALGARPAVPESSTDYERARRSVRIWPIGGEGEQIVDNVSHFLRDALGLDEDKVGVFTALRSVSPPGAGLIYDEIVALFATPQIRDMVMSRGPKLAGFVDKDRKPTCGLRQEIPNHLVPSFRILHKYGINLKKRAPDAKKHIKFDDYNRTLFIQVKVDEDSEWINVSVDEASNTIKKSDAKRSQRLRSLFSPDTGTEGMPPSRRTASESALDEPMSTPASSFGSQRPAWRPGPRAVEQRSKE